jgi:hypothetical protein
MAASVPCADGAYHDKRVFGRTPGEEFVSVAGAEDRPAVTAFALLEVTEGLAGEGGSAEGAAGPWSLGCRRGRGPAPWALQ